MDGLDRKIWKTAWPAVLEMAMYMVIGIADVAFVGRLGAAPLAAVSLGAELFFGIILTVASLGVGGAVLAAHFQGASQKERIGEVAATVLLLGFVSGVFTGFAGFYLTPHIVGLFNIQEDVASMTVKYMKITFCMSPVALALYMGNSVFRGIGRTKIPMMIALITNVINVAGDYVLVLGRWGFPGLGAEGAAWATTFSHVVGLVLMLLAMSKESWGVKVSAQVYSRISAPVLGKVLKLGIPSALEELVREAGIVAGSYFLVNLGTVAFAAHQIAVTVESVSFMPGYGFAVAATSLVGQNLGAQKPEAAKQAALRSFRLAALAMGVAAVLFFVFPSAIARLFTDEPPLILLAALAIKIAAFEQIAIAAEMTLAGALRGAGDTRSPMLITMLGVWLIRQPMLWLLIKRLHLGLMHVWILFVCDWVLRSFLVYLVFRGSRRLQSQVSPREA